MTKGGAFGPGLAPFAAPTPIVDHFGFVTDPAERQRLDRLAARLLANEPRLATTDVFGDDVAQGSLPGPRLVFEDHTEVDGVPERHSPLEYRSLLLAGDEDLVAIEGPRSPAFEAYCRDELALGHPEIIRVAPQADRRPGRLARRCVEDEVVAQRVFEVARRRGTLTILPYLGGGWTWRLAGLVAARTQASVRVAAPPPSLTRRVNDKLWFAEVVAEVLGRRARPPTYSAFGLAALTRRVVALASRFERVVVKLPRASAALGNVVFEASELTSLGPREVQQQLASALGALGWRETYPLMVGVWLCSVLASPSVQVWIPKRDEGSPIVEGVFAQALAERVGKFVGAEPAVLPAPITQRIVEEAASLSTLFQALGYYGRCSFDTVLVGERISEADLHWIECNGRWGGVSIAMTLANRLSGDWASNPFVVVQLATRTGARRSLGEVLRRLDGHLFRPGRCDRGVVLLAPERLVRGTGVNLMSIGPTIEAARSEAAAALAVLENGY